MQLNNENNIKTYNIFKKIYNIAIYKYKKIFMNQIKKFS